MSKKISELTAVTDVTPSDLFQVIDVEDPAMASSGTNKKVTAQTLGNYLPVRALGSTTSRTLSERFGDTVNVKDFGAAGDGIQDDTAAIQAALNTGKHVTIPDGVYCHSVTLSIWKNNQTLSGSRNAVLKKTTNIDAIRITGNYNMVAGISQNGNNKLYSGIGIFGLKNTVRDCYIYNNYGHGVYRDGTTTGCRWSIVSDNIVENSGEVGISCWNTEDNVTIGNVVSNSGAEGLTDDGTSYRSLFVGNKLYDNCQTGGVGGMGIDQASNSIVTGNIISNTQSNLPGIGFQNNVGNTTNLTVSGNGLFDNTGGGILLGGNTTSGFYAFKNVLSSNTFQNNTGFDIKINTGNTDNTITGIQKGITIIDNSTTSSRTGVGTSNPSEQFHVAGGNALFQRTESTTGAIYLGGKNSYVFGDVSANTVSIGTNNLARFIVKDTGIKISNLQTYATNAEAIAGGLVVNDAYKTSTGEIRIVI